MSKASKRLARSRRQILAQQTKTPARPAVPEHDADAAPPDELVALYMEIAEFTEANPGKAQVIKSMEDTMVASIVAGIAWSDAFGYAEKDCLRNANLIKWWAVMNGFIYLFDWPEPIGIMTSEQIVAQARKDRAAGIIPDPRLND